MKQQDVLFTKKQLCWIAGIVVLLVALILIGVAITNALNPSRELAAVVVPVEPGDVNYIYVMYANGTLQAQKYCGKDADGNALLEDENEVRLEREERQALRDLLKRCQTEETPDAADGIWSVALGSTEWQSENFRYVPDTTDTAHNELMTRLIALGELKLAMSEAE